MKYLVFILLVAVSLSAQDRNVKHDYGTNTVSVPDTYLYLPQDAYSKTVPPEVTNDVTEGFYVGSVWHDTTNLKAYICLANTTNNAQWKEVTSVASGYVDVAGTPANDQIAVFVDADTVEGNSAFTFDGSTMTLGADFHVNSNGNIGINTTTPTADIDIAENETNFGSINFTHGGAGGHGGKISIYHTGLTQQYQGVIELVDDGSYNADLIYSAKNAGTVGAPLEEKFRFDSSGNVFDITGSLTSSVDLQAPTITLEDATHSVRLALDGDRIFHDTNDDGTKDPGENYIDESQVYDAELAAIAGTTSAADALPYFTGSGTASTTTLTTFARTLLDDTTQGAMQATLGVDPIGTDNSTDVTLAGSPDYITISSQTITRHQIDLATDVTNNNPVYRTFFVSAGAMASRTTNGAAFNSEEYATNDVQVDTYLFDGATDEAVTFQFTMPDAWDLGTIKVKVYWDGSSGMSAADTIEFEVSATAYADSDAIDTAFASPVTITDDLITIGDTHVSAASAALTVQGTPALGDLIVMQILRDVSVETVPEDAKLIGVAIQYREKSTATAAW